MVKLVNRAKMTTSTTGTGTITLGSASDGYQTFAAAGVSNTDVVRYTIEDGSAWEIGTGTYTASGTTLSRTVTESSNSDNALNLTGNAVVFVTAAASDIPTGTSLTKTFVQNEEATITLANAVSPVPTIGVFKEIPQAGVSSKGNWDVNSTASNYDRFDEAPVSFSGATLTPSSATADGTFTLSSGSFASGDVGKTVEGNAGKAVITATSGTYDLVTSFTNTSAIAAGSWALYGVVPKADGSGLTLSTYVPPAWDLGNAAYNNVNIDPASGVGNSINGIAVSTNGLKLYASSASVIYQYSITGGDISTASYDSKSYTSSRQTGIKTISFKPDGTKMYLCGSSGNTVYQYSLDPEWDVSTASYDSKSVTASWGGLHGHCFNDDGSKLYLTRSANSSNASVNSFSLTSEWDISTASDDNVRIVTVSQGGNTAQGIAFNGDGSKLFVIGQSSSKDYLFQYNLTSGFDLSTASYSNVSFQIQDTNASINYNAVDLHFSSDGAVWYTSDNGQQPKLYQYSSGAAPYFPTGQYLPSATKTGGQINSAYWTDINSMTADEAAGNGTVNYAVSTDDRTIWKIAHNTSGIRSIAKNNSGTWQYNSNSTYGSETWANATTNSELAALQQALSVAQNRMNKTQLDAVADANHFALGSTLDLMIAVQMASGSIAPKSDGVSINYDAAAVNRQAINGTDYEAEFPSTTSVNIKSLAAQNLKVKVL